MSGLAAAWAELDVGRYKSEFYRQWHIGHAAGLMHHQVLETMDDFARSPTVHELRRFLLAGTKRRVSLQQLTTQRPELFVPFEAALLRLGEASGALDHCLTLLADYFTAEYRLMLWLKKKLAYPMTNMLLACFIAPFALLFFGHTVAYLVIALGSAGALLLSGGRLLREAAARYRQKPAFVLARLLRALTVAVEAGLSLDQAVQLAAAASGSARLVAHVQAQGHRAGGQPLGTTLAGAPGVPREVIAALEVAEVTGNYGETLGRLADLYDPGGASRRGAPLAFPP